MLCTWSISNPLGPFRLSPAPWSPRRDSTMLDGGGNWRARNQMRCPTHSLTPPRTHALPLAHSHSRSLSLQTPPQRGQPTSEHTYIYSPDGIQRWGGRQWLSTVHARAAAAGKHSKAGARAAVIPPRPPTHAASAQQQHSLSGQNGAHLTFSIRTRYRPLSRHPAMLEIHWLVGRPCRPRLGRRHV